MKSNAEACCASKNYFESKLRDLKAKDLYRSSRKIDGPQGPEVDIDGRRVILMCSNNYLDLANHPSLVEAASKAAFEFGVGAGASRLVSGTMAIHCRLEEKLAQFKQVERCLLFNSGYHANVGTISSVVGKGDVVYSDALNHASIIDGIRLSRATVKIYPHLDMGELENMLSCESCAGKKAIITESVFSMDGDVVALDKIVELKKRYGAFLILDEAHSTGVAGPGGRGLAAQFGLTGDVDFMVCTLGKALGTFGAFVAGRRDSIEWLINSARSFIFTTAPPPPIAAASLAAVELIERQPERVDALKRNALYFRRSLSKHGFCVAENEIPIIPLVVGEARAALYFADRLFERGIFCQAIRPPSVPEGMSRLRLTVTSSHTTNHLDYVANCIAEFKALAGNIKNE